MTRPFHMNCGKLHKCDECLYHDALETLMEDFGMGRKMAKDFLAAQHYGMSAQRFIATRADVTARNIAEAYMPEGLQ